MSHQHHDEHPLNHKGQLFFFALFLTVWICDSFFLNISNIYAADISLWIRLAVLGLLIILVVYFFKGVISAFPEDEASDDIVANGPFKYVRHPMYLACILFYFGLSFSTLSLFSFALLVPIFLFYDHIASYEEKFLMDKHGEPYEQYIKKVHKWIPR